MKARAYSIKYKTFVNNDYLKNSMQKGLTDKEILNVVLDALCNNNPELLNLRLSKTD